MNFKNFELVKEDFSILEDWEDRYSYIIDLGREMPKFDEELKSEENKVLGCASQVWIKLETFDKDGVTRLDFRGDSDAMIVKGLIAIIGSIYDKSPVDKLSKIEPLELFGSLDLLSHLSSQRSNGLNSMLKKIQDFY